jgi:hypothetical protein
MYFSATDCLYRAVGVLLTTTLIEVVCVIVNNKRCLLFVCATTTEMGSLMQRGEARRDSDSCKYSARASPPPRSQMVVKNVGGDRTKPFATTISNGVTLTHDRTCPIA